MKKIILTTLNAKYIHSAVGLRYVFANLKEYRQDAKIIEFVFNESLFEITEKLLDENPTIIGFSVYIWNASEISDLIKIIKKVSPNTFIVLGGPEVSHFPLRCDFGVADYIIQGEAEIEFYNLCSKLLKGIEPTENIIKAAPVNLCEIQLPYEYYNDEDIKNRVIYVEASRGCPFTCEFCLSSIDKSVRYFDTSQILREFETLWQRGVRNFKFVDRTFNLNLKIAEQILDFFLAKQPPFHLHFEVIPEHFPDELKNKLKMFPDETVQLEIGIQTLNPQVAENICRKLNFEKIKENILFLENETNAHLHVDLIFGLPGESIESIANNMNELVKLTTSKIQLGVLKKLSGTAISRHDEIYGMVYPDKPPYEILQNNLISYVEMQKLKRIARYWEIINNSGNFERTIARLWVGTTVFDGFSSFSDWLYKTTLSTFQISLNRLAEFIFVYLTEIKEFDKKDIAQLIISDLLSVHGRRLPPFFNELAKELKIAK